MATCHLIGFVLWLYKPFAIGFVPRPLAIDFCSMAVQTVSHRLCFMAVWALLKER